MPTDCARCARIGVKQPADRRRFGEDLCDDCVDDVESRDGF